MKTAAVIRPYYPPGKKLAEDEEDTLDQTRLISSALKNLGYKVKELQCTLNFEKLRKELVKLNPAFCFNLVEDIEDSSSLCVAVALLLEHIKMPVAGSPSSALYLSTHKPAAKAFMQYRGIPTPVFFFEGSSGGNLAFPAQYIIKPECEDASIGIDHDSLIQAENLSDLQHKIKQREDLIEKKCFAEEFINGREINISIIADNGSYEILPPAEILFIDFPADKPKILDYEAKWGYDSFACRNTPRSFKFDSTDQKMLERAQKLAMQAFKIYGCRGYARIDFRADESELYVIETNANPCLAEECGLIASAAQRGYSYDDVIKRIVSDIPGIS